MKKKVSVSGIKPTGSVHIGNYLGAIRNFIKLQNDPSIDNYYFIADYHALNTIFDPKILHQNRLEMFMSLISLGINPEKSTLFLQSNIPQVTELSFLLTGIIPMGLIERSHAYKDEKTREHDVNVGLFYYPILQTADILIYQADLVPVGQDQKQHIEIARDIAQKFNRVYGPCFTIPEPHILETHSVPGTDGNKMSKRYNNTIPIFASEKELKTAVMNIVTDSTPLEAPKNYKTCPIYNIYQFFASQEASNTMRQHYQEGNYGYGQAKNALFELLFSYFSEARNTMEHLKKNQDHVQKMLKIGTEKAQIVAEKTINNVREIIGLY